MSANPDWLVPQCSQRAERLDAASTIDSKHEPSRGPRTGPEFAS
jgi:hypothetical protein